MSADEAKAAAARLGQVKVTHEGSTSAFRTMKVLAVHPQFEIVFHIWRGKALRAAEVWIPPAAGRGHGSP
ncbi:hypothetical protein ACIRPK_09115 [Kitasatospora sp. NPDC101801]|uniref:hypothetical protein n=1 Tax=Kitasatospora sp. NPDC101801 TaxID=3364103 RepID=UPI0037FDC509